MGLLNEPEKITKYKLQNTNKSQITMSKITNSPGGLDKSHHFLVLRRRRLKFVRRTLLCL